MYVLPLTLENWKFVDSLIEFLLNIMSVANSVHEIVRLCPSLLICQLLSNEPPISVVTFHDINFFTFHQIYGIFGVRHNRTH